MGAAEEAHVCEASLLDRKSLIAFAVSDVEPLACVRNSVRCSFKKTNS